MRDFVSHAFSIVHHFYINLYIKFTKTWLSNKFDELKFAFQQVDYVN